MDTEQHWPCTTCGDEAAFEQPPCADGHTADGGECPEWVCTGCGAGVFLGAPGPVVAARRAAGAAA